MLFICAALASSQEILGGRIFMPEIKISNVTRPKECKRIVTETSLVTCEVIAQIKGQALPIINTYETKKRLTFKMDNKRIIPGFLKGVSGSCLGEKRRITIPPERAYGDRSVDGLFDPASTWIIDIEIIDIVEGGAI